MIIKELRDTVTWMTEGDWKQRFVAEYCQLKIRYQKLRSINVKFDAGFLDFTPHCPMDLLREQQQLMGQLLYIMEKRAVFENITLPESVLVIDTDPNK